MKRLRFAAATLVAAAIVGPQVAVAQITERVEAVDRGVVRFHYATRDGVEVCSQGIRIGGRQVAWRSRGRTREPSDCRTDDVEVELTVRDGSVVEVEIVRDGSALGPDGSDVGRVSPQAAVRYLVALARESASGDAGQEAVLPALVADVPEVWRELLGLARDRGVLEDTRKSALFWLGQEAADAVTANLQDVALDSDEAQEVRNAAVFALSQRPNGEAIPILIDIARDADETATRRTAMFWLAQAEDERVVDFFEGILLRRNR